MSSLIELRDITFAYPGSGQIHYHEHDHGDGRPHEHPPLRLPGIPVLRNVDLALDPGERLCLTGANGAGKSTLLQVIVGLLKPQAGQVIAFGKQRKLEADFREVRCRAGYVFQDPDDQLFCPTVLEDVAFGPLNLGKSKEEALSIVDSVLSALQLQAFRDRITYKLSGGERRLVSLATVLAMDPEVLLLDEPTNALDEPTTKRLTEILLSLPQAMIIVSHDPHFRRDMHTRILHLEAGRIEPGAPPRPRRVEATLPS